MRIQAGIFAIYLFTLALLPCGDQFPMPGNIDLEATFEAISGHDYGNHDSDYHDLCSPLCLCVCCGVILDFPPELLAVELQALPPRGMLQPAFEQQWKVFSLTDGNWQPPRLALS